VSVVLGCICRRCFYRDYASLNKPLPVSLPPSFCFSRLSPPVSPPARMGSCLTFETFCACRGSSFFVGSSYTLFFYRLQCLTLCFLVVPRTNFFFVRCHLLDPPFNFERVRLSRVSVGFVFDTLQFYFSLLLRCFYGCSWEPDSRPPHRLE